MLRLVGQDNSVSKDGVDGLLEDLSYLTLETQKAGNGKVASDCVDYNVPEATVGWKRALWVAVINEVGFLIEVNRELFIQWIISTSKDRPQTVQVFKMFFADLFERNKRILEKQPKKWKDLSKEVGIYLQL